MLLRWYRRNARDLPWRRTRDPYLIWLSEVILQQTRVDQGTPYYERFCAAFPTVADLAAAPDRHVLKLWEGLGYYARARNLHRAAKAVVADYGGQFPRTAAGLAELPGIGRYTAGAIASIAYGEPAPVVDGNVARVLARLFALSASIDDAKTKDLLWDIAARLVPQKQPGDFNQAMMELGARVCLPRGADCAHCPVRAACRAHAEGLVDQLPVRGTKTRPPHHHHAMAVIVSGGKYLLHQRPDNGLLAGLWEFPSVRLLDHQDHAAALQALAAKEWDVTLDVGDSIGVIRHAFTHFHVTIHVYRCIIAAGKIAPTQTLKWLRPEQLHRYPMPKTQHKLLHLLD